MLSLVGRGRNSWFDDAVIGLFSGGSDGSERGLGITKSRDNDSMMIPKSDCYVEDGTVFLKLEMPGVKKEDIQISIEDGVLSVEGKKDESNESKSRDYYLSERFSGYFKRSWNIGKSVKTDAIKATCNNGILQITYPLEQQKKEANVRKIEIS